MGMFKHSHNWRDSITKLLASTVSSSCPILSFPPVCAFVCLFGWLFAGLFGWLFAGLFQSISHTWCPSFRNTCVAHILLFLCCCCFFFIRELTANWLKSNHHQLRPMRALMTPSLPARSQGWQLTSFHYSHQQVHFPVFHSFFFKKSDNMGNTQYSRNCPKLKEGHCQHPSPADTRRTCAISSKHL